MEFGKCHIVTSLLIVCYDKVKRPLLDAFVEVETKDALRKCGAREKKKKRWLNMREMAKEILKF